MPTDPDCPQCKGCGRVADLPQFPKPAWEDWENRPRAGPDPMTDFVKAVPCPRCHPQEEVVAEKPSDLVVECGVKTVAARLREKAVGYRRQAEQVEGLAKVAEELTPGSNAERAFVDFIKAQGIEL